MDVKIILEVSNVKIIPQALYMGCHLKQLINISF